MIVKTQVVVDDGVVCMVGLEQVFERAWALLRGRFDVVDFNRGNRYGGMSTCGSQERGFKTRPTSFGPVIQKF